jgi:hypothetical protein
LKFNPNGVAPRSWNRRRSLPQQTGRRIPAQCLHDPGVRDRVSAEILERARTPYVDIVRYAKRVLRYLN